jgi:16S rRNA (uracil1498-N3)-methyltransferase
MDAAIRDAVMLGAAAVQPFVARRSEVSLAALVGGGRRARWQKIAVASAKQCGRAVVPPVRDPLTFDGLMDSLDARGAGGPILLLAEPSAGAEVAAIGQIETTAPRSAVVVVGPEGGWAAEELARAAGRCRFVSLGGRTLRAETVPLVALTALLTRWSAL